MAANGMGATQPSPECLLPTGMAWKSTTKQQFNSPVPSALPALFSSLLLNPKPTLENTKAKKKTTELQKRKTQKGKRGTRETKAVSTRTHTEQARVGTR